MISSLTSHKIVISPMVLEATSRPAMEGGKKICHVKVLF